MLTEELNDTKQVVVCGNEQIAGENFNKIFAPTLELMNARVIIAYATMWGVPPMHGDIPNAFPRADTEEGIEIFVEIPAGAKISQDIMDNFGVERQNQLVLKLNKSLYGLKQAGRL